MKLLISPRSLDEAQKVIAGGADIVDIKNPAEGSLGAGSPRLIKAVKKLTGDKTEVSAALGDISVWMPGTIGLAAYGAMQAGANYVKMGALKINEQQAIDTAKACVSALNGSCSMVIAAYADASRVNGLSPLKIPQIATSTNSHVAMIDTAIKDGRGLLKNMKTYTLRKFIKESHGYGLKVALAGEVKLAEIELLKSLETDIIGLRSAVCENGQRNASINEARIRELVEFCKKI
ncbi:MAG: (5-formylfuran-3-yl)methyl phosphate synthase [Promethearchaeota archaeon]